MNNEIQSFNIRLTSLSAKDLAELDVKAYGVESDASLDSDKFLLRLEVYARNSAWKPTSQEGELKHITAERAGLAVDIVCSGVGVGASSSLSGIFATTVSVDKSSASYHIYTEYMPGPINDALLSGVPLNSAISELTLEKIGTLINADWPNAIRDDPGTLVFSEFQISPRRVSFADRLAQARKVRDVMQRIASATDLTTYQATIGEMRADYAAKGEPYPGPSEVLAEAIYRSLGVRGTPSRTEQDEARDWLHLYT
jgi:hypothetical protein